MSFLRRHEATLVFLVVFFISLTVVFSTSKIFDFDSFYHLKHASLYQTQGILNSSFPFVQYSVINKESADLWYGFHLFLIPFTLFSDLLFGLKLSIIFIFTLTLSSFYYLLRSHNYLYPALWTALLAFSSADFFFRLFMSRPHLISLFASIIFLSLLSRSKWFWSILPGFIITFFHLSLAWVPLLLALTVSFYRLFLAESRRTFFLPLVSLFGIFLGWIMRPNPLGALNLAYVQIIELFSVKAAGLPMQFGRELKTLSSFDVTLQYLPLITLIVLSGFLFYHLFRKHIFNNLALSEKLLLLSFGSLISLFFILAFTSARRSTDFVSIFLVLFLASLTTHLKKNINHYSLMFTVSTLLVVMVLSNIYVFLTFVSNSNQSDQFKTAALWLKDNTPESSIVFNPYWDDFPKLFFWNSHNYYINGMDPIFAYAYSEDLYWKNYFIAYAGTPVTCGQIKCVYEEEQEDIATVLKRDFHADYLFIDPNRNHNLYSYLSEGLPGLTEVFRSSDAIIYSVSDSVLQ